MFKKNDSTELQALIRRIEWLEKQNDHLLNALLSMSHETALERTFNAENAQAVAQASAQNANGDRFPTREVAEEMMRAMQEQDYQSDPGGNLDFKGR